MADQPTAQEALRKPPWIRVRLGTGEQAGDVNRVVHGCGLHTVCDEALCPNKGECWSHGHATIMILGDTCSRTCRFCNVSSRKPSGVDQDEPRRVVDGIRQMGLRYVVLTSVTRDDLPDGGAAIWAATLRAVREGVPGVQLEVLIPDFLGRQELLDLVFAMRPDVLGHNLETVPRLYSDVRPQAVYDRSLQVLSRAHAAGLIAKTALMLGLGETAKEVESAMQDARSAGCDILYLGQYLQPSKRHAAVQRYVPPEAFDALAAVAQSYGFSVVVAAPLVRSSYYSREQQVFLDEKWGGRQQRRSHEKREHDEAN